MNTDQSKTNGLRSEYSEVRANRKGMGSHLKNTLTLQQQLKLADVVRAQYVARDEDDVSFAIYASTVLDLQLTRSNIASVREACGIPNKMRKAPVTVLERLEAIEKRLSALEIFMAVKK